MRILCAKVDAGDQSKISHKKRTQQCSSKWNYTLLKGFASDEASPSPTHSSTDQAFLFTNSCFTFRTPNVISLQATAAYTELFFLPHPGANGVNCWSAVKRQLSLSLWLNWTDEYTGLMS